MPLARYVKSARRLATRAAPYVTAAAATALRARIRARQASSRTTSADVSNTTSVRFRDMGDRGSVSTTKYKTRKRRKMSARKRKAIKTFKRRVRQVINAKQPMSCLQETWSPALSWRADTLDNWGQTLAGGFQSVIGNASTWGLNMGEAAASGGQESSYIQGEAKDYNLRENGADVVITAEESRENGGHFVKRRYSKLTVQNTSPSKDLIFDLYECVAAQDISDPNYANPVITWTFLTGINEDQSTGTWGIPVLKGSEPTDCPRFGKYWRVLKKHKCRIPWDAAPANAYQTFKMSSRPFYWDGNRFKDKWAVGGLTKYWMMIIDPEQGSTRYAGIDLVCSVYGHRNTHFRWDENNTLGGKPKAEWLRLVNTGPSQ